jgi:hypothetical protein
MKVSPPSHSILDHSDGGQVVMGLRCAVRHHGRCLHETGLHGAQTPLTCQNVTAIEISQTLTERTWERNSQLIRLRPETNSTDLAEHLDLAIHFLGVQLRLERQSLAFC